MNYRQEYLRWMANADEVTRNELLSLTDEKEKEDRFYRKLEFGTGGLRGVIGAGTNRINSYVVAGATQGLAAYIKKHGIAAQGVVIAYDSRNFSREFAETTSRVLNANGIKTYLFDELRPTPELSFAVRYLSAAAGIVITASHNPAEYNGYKIYWSDGGQIPPEIAAEILEEINKVDVFDVQCAADSDLQTVIGSEVDEAYLERVYEQAINPVSHSVKIVYTPLHGSGNKLVRKILRKAGFNEVSVVKEQEKPDGNFPTVASPNPENRESFTLALKLAETEHADLIIGTDPDSDRVGVMVRNRDNEYIALTGNQVGVLLANYILSSIKLTGNEAIVSTIVSTRMIRPLTEYYQVRYFDTLTGFKYIGEKIHEFEQNQKEQFLFGFEESYGFLKGTYCRDKDAVAASMLIAEMTAHYAEQGLTLPEMLERLYCQFGGFYEEQQSITLEGMDGIGRIQEIMASLRQNELQDIGGIQVVHITDYMQPMDLPKADVLCFELKNQVNVLIRPSGTEPKLKIYYLSRGETYLDARRKAGIVKGKFQSFMIK